ncbi:MAG: IS256 family transposase [Gorillibacterium sp.]|nr:IS256 family transposase [Gorillibacterium sp.]
MSNEWAVKTLTELLYSVNEDVDPIDRVLAGCLGCVRRVLENVMEAERDIFCGVGPSQRDSARRDYRNGYYERDFASCFGVLEKLRVPRTRSGKFRSSLFGRFERRQRKVNELIRSLFLCGLSQRSVADVLGPFLGIEPSASTVSAIAKSLDSEIERFKRRGLDDDFDYLILDGIALSVKISPYAVGKCVLVAMGIRGDGSKELLGFRVEHSESEACWERLLNDLYTRGLEGQNLKLVISDGGAGLLKAMSYVYPDVPHQRCWVHKIRNVFSKLKRCQRKECLRGLRDVWQASNRREAERAYQAWEAEWIQTAPEAVECVKQDLDELLVFLSFPTEHWQLIRTTNHLERCFREFRRRLRPIGCQKNTASCERMLYALCTRLNLRWKKKRICQPTVFTQVA